MNTWNLALRIFVCIFTAGVMLFSYIDKTNKLTELQLMIPALQKEVRHIQFENIRLQYEVDRFENPVHLMELASKPEYSHLKYPYEKDVVIISKENKDVSKE